ncbi:cysteine-rich PDZ-binding protein [Coregonus clupeaformis]|uniref:cysteine-rich PDZ-binding protein n=1 Tax=Coregonus clupeaformis TaxID=59861 RepID=UPI001E1C464B|nr:cysteine-rich PDZ-binding protein [Coregonus clupeaformis]
MFCDNCEKKLGRVRTPDTWKDGARNTTCRYRTRIIDTELCYYTSFDPYGKPGNSGKSGFGICRICKSSVHQSGSHYCQGCAYKERSRDERELYQICAMCGKKVLDTKNYKQTSV